MTLTIAHGNPSLARARRLVLFLSALAVASPVLAEPIAVVTRDGSVVVSLSKQEVADLFLGKRQITVDNLSLTPVDVADESLRETFYQSVAEMSAVRVNAYWARLVFSAQGRPPRKLPLNEARAMVQSRPGLVTYLAGNATGGFKILLKLPE